MVGASESVTVSGPGLDFHLGLVVGEDPYSFLVDRLGSTLGLVDDGGIAATFQVGPFGETVQTGGDPLTPTAWAGLDQDPAGIYQVRARYYHPGLSRFVSEDPLGLAGGGVNLYVYAGGDPVNHTDPTGLSPDGLVDLIFIALDLHNLFTGGRKDLGENLAALGLDVLGLMIPIVTGLGAAGRHLDDVDDIGRALRGTDNIDDVFKGVCSFSGETEVLMGDGTAKPISEVEIGDQVRSYDPATGTETNETVTAVWVHDDTFVVLETEAGAVTTTDDHPFGTTDRNWTQADDLATGDLLVAAGGDQVGVTAPAEPTGQTGPAYNLTVSQTHTYYIVVGDQAVLVHNTCGWRGIGRTDEESQILHHERHGAGRTFEQYINDSYDWQRTIPDPRSGELTRLNDRTQGYRHRDPAGGPGGILDGNGCIITFWYDSRC
jgi:RHS repeat-associated protein